ncbi:TraB/GumN family protein [Parvularcula marina]|uniref:TraB/GumN family protein n=1 Tax=Parvularcula marina TaxID=2292771 RepID=A0A371RJ39_9PROT|nr:TraB/GumN family protein [Parvularcula marina]RFB05461.1 TraB/GumN family protein [Parvularcula marina]
MTRTLKSALLGVSALAFAGATSFAADDAPKTLAEATEGPSNVAIWKTGDADTTVYMMGTIHILHPDLDWETDAFEAAWAEANAVFFEANVTSPEEVQAASPLIMSEGFYTDGRKFADLFTADQREELNEALKEYGLTAEALGNMRPWFASIQLTQLAMAKAGGDPAAGIEMLLGARASEEGKTQRYFEGLAEQIQIIADVPDEVWAKSLIEGVDELSDVEGYFAEMVGLWYDGDADGLAEFMSDGWEETPELASKLLYERNEKWAVKIDRLIEEEEGTFLVAVGAGHLAGAKSVQDYLTQHGHESVRVNP